MRAVDWAAALARLLIQRINSDKLRPLQRAVNGRRGFFLGVAKSNSSQRRLFATCTICDLGLKWLEGAAGVALSRPLRI